ncbi:MAG: triose-phosphate isomerase family protein [Aerococcaceae bacterium]|nr:triose-phosphate isomerase family protein [Aerococcaceae bacterium]
MTKKIHLNLKRFDVLKQHGGVNTNPDSLNWAKAIIEKVEQPLATISQKQDIEFVIYFPEAHLIKAIEACENTSNVNIGCQGVFREDVSEGGNFGAFTTHRTAKSMLQLGVSHTIIGHFEERKHLSQIFSKVTEEYMTPLNELLNEEVLQAQAAGLDVLYCIGESLEQRDQWREVLRTQIEVGLKNTDTSHITIGYEPIWAIGPGKTPPTAEQITEVAAYIKTLLPDSSVIYGGGLKQNNAQKIANIAELDGGLIALTRFTGEIGFYPDEYIDIIETYFS